MSERIRPKDHLVNLHDTRSQDGGIGTPDKCFYCPAAPGEPHDEGCVVPERLALVELRVRFVMPVTLRDPETHLMEFNHNEGTHCTDNLLDRMERHNEVIDGCLCVTVTRDWKWNFSDLKVIEYLDGDSPYVQRWIQELDAEDEEEEGKAP
jgi:hypothetical protein